MLTLGTWHTGRVQERAPVARTNPNATNAQRLGTQRTQHVTHHLLAAHTTHIAPTKHTHIAKPTAAATAVAAVATNAAAVCASEARSSQGGHGP